MVSVGCAQPLYVAIIMCMLAIGAFQLRVQNATINISGNRAVHKARKANFFYTFLILFYQNQEFSFKYIGCTFHKAKQASKTETHLV